MKKTIFPILVTALVLGNIMPAPTYADDGLDIQVCAAVFPCGLNNDVLPEFATGSCYPVYKKQCEELAPQSVSATSIQKQVVQCRIAKRNLKVSLHKKDQLLGYYKMKVALLKAQIAQLKK